MIGSKTPGIHHYGSRKDRFYSSHSLFNSNIENIYRRHGQLYVGVSKISHPDHLKIGFSNLVGKRHKCENIVFKEILSGSK